MKRSNQASKQSNSKCSKATAVNERRVMEEESQETVLMSQEAQIVKTEGIRSGPNFEKVALVTI